MAWGKSIFMIFGNIGKSLHHQIPSNWFWEWRTQYFVGVAHTIFFGSGAHDICREWRTRYVLGVAARFVFVGPHGARDL